MRFGRLARFGRRSTRSIDSLAFFARNKKIPLSLEFQFEADDRSEERRKDSRKLVMLDVYAMFGTRRWCFNRFVYFQRQGRFLIRWLLADWSRSSLLWSFFSKGVGYFWVTLCIVWFSKSFSPSSLLTPWEIHSYSFSRCILSFVWTLCLKNVIRDDRKQRVLKDLYLLNFICNYHMFLFSISYKLMIKNDSKSLDI